MTPQQILTEADRCVKCGFCLPHCPTYRHTLDEGESPRGRIALIQGWVSGRLEDSVKLQGHLDRCLACRACETACPSAVHYGRLIDGARELEQQRLGFLRRTLRAAALGLITRRWSLRLASGLLRLLGRKGVATLLRLSGLPSLRRAVNLAPALPRPTRWCRRYTAATPVLGRVGLFTGCISRITDQAALLAAVRILNRLGREVVVPPQQGCCGAMHLHAGDPDVASRLAQHNRRAFAGAELEAIVGIASGCTAQLMEYPHLLDKEGLPAPVQDISAFLTDLPWPEGLQLKPLPKRVAVHDPCSLRNVLKMADAPYRLLRKIPDIELVALPGNALCCGAAGAYLLTQPDMADALRADKLTALGEDPPDILVTSNTGCALHLAAGIRASGLAVEVLHPVQLLERQFPDSA